MATEQAVRYDAFISYSRKDEKFARKLEAALERYRPPKGALADRQRLNVFRDVQDLVGNELVTSIQEALRQSRYLIVVCSPAARASQWVSKEVEAFAKRRGRDFVIPVLAHGRPNTEVRPDDATQDQAFPEGLCRCLEEPLAADFRDEQYPGETAAHRKTRRNEAKYQVLALLLAREKGELLQRQRAHRRRVQVTFGAVGVVAFLAMAALTTWALQNAAEARRQARLALSRQLAYQSTGLRTKDLVVSLLLAAAACSVANTAEARGALLDGLQQNPRLAAFFRGPRGFVHCVAFSPNGEMLAAGGEDSTVVLWDVASQQQIGTLEGHDDGVNCIAFSPDGRALASGSADGTVILWDVAGRRPRATLAGYGGGVNSVAFSPDGKTLASGSWDSTVVLWDVASRRRIGALEGHSSSVNSVAFSPDGMTLISGSDDYTVIVWHVASQQSLGQLEDHGESVWSVAFSPDGEAFASGSADSTVILWNSSRRRTGALEGHDMPVTSVAFSPDGKILATGSLASTVFLWHVESQPEFGTPQTGHVPSASSVALGPDGGTNASGDEGITPLKADVDVWIGKAKRIANRGLTSEERRRYLGTE